MANGNDTQQVSVALAQAVNNEGNPGDTPTRFDFVVTRTGKTDESLNVDWELRVAGTDPAEVNDLASGQPTAGTVVFAPDVLEQTVSVFIAGDIDVETDEQFALALDGNGLPAGTTLGTASAVATISNDDPTVTISPSLAQALDEGNPDEDPTIFSYTLSREGDLNEALTVSWAVAPRGDFPVDADDFPGGALPEGQVTFAPGAGQADMPINFEVNGDSDFEADEQFQVELSLPENAPAGTILGLDKVNGTILNDDAAPPPELSIAAANAVQAEGNTGDAPATDFTFTVTRTGEDLNQSSTVNWAALGSGDFPAGLDDVVEGTPTSGQLTFAPGQTEQQITLLVNGDTDFEPDEGFTVTLSDATNAELGQATATGTILNDDAAPPPELSIAAANAVQAEGNTGDAPATDFTFTVTRTGEDLNQSSTVNWAALGSGDFPAGLDDVVEGTPTSGQLTFAPGQTEQQITLLVNGDTDFEPDEGFTVTLSDATNAELGQATATGTILNDDAAPPPELSIAAANAVQAEGNTGDAPATDFTFTVTRTGEDLNQSSTVNWAALGSGDFPAGLDDVVEGTPTSGQLTFAPGQTEQQITLLVNGDTDFEPDEGFTVTLSDATNAELGQATATGTILNDDAAPPPVLSIAAANAVQAEGNTGDAPATDFTFTVTRTGEDLNQSSTVNWAALGSGDFPAGLDDVVEGTPTSGQLTFAPGQTEQQITLLVNGDTDFEPDEGFTVTLSNPQNATISQATAMGTIENDDEKVITGTEGDDTITPDGNSPGVTGGIPSDADDTINALGGNDIVDGGGGADTIDGGGGNDTLDGGAGNDTIDGGSFSDVIDGGAGNDTLDGGSGPDTLLGGGGNDTLDGGGGNDVLDGGADDDTLTDSGGGSDTLLGGDGNDTLLDSGGGNDTLDGGGGNDTLDGGTGADIYVFAGDNGADTITTFATGTDLIDLTDYGLSSLDDFVLQQDGDDTLIFGYDNVDNTNTGNTIRLENIQSGGLGTEDFILDANANVIQGTINNDDITPDGNSDGVIGEEPSDGPDIIKALGGDDNVNSGGGDDVIDGAAGNDILAGGSGNDFLAGANGDDTLDGGEGNDVLRGEGGADTLDGGSGDDLLEGGGSEQADIFAFTGNNGNDTISDFEDGFDRIDFTAYAVTDVSDFSIVADGVNTVISGYNGAGNTITLQNFDSANLGNDDFIFDAAPPPTGTPTAGDDILFGTPGDDSIQALDGDDIVLGQGGNDTLIGDLEPFEDEAGIGGDDFISGGDGDDAIFGDSAAALSATQLGGNDTLLGDAGSDTLIGDAASLREFAVGGDDLLIAGEGVDGGPSTMYGDGLLLTGAAQGGDDVLIGGGSSDIIFGDALDFFESPQGGDDRLFGGGGDDVLFGDAGKLEASSRAGNDRIEGGKGNDLLWGDGEIIEGGVQRGEDAFVFSTGEGMDTIGDFQPGVDKIILADVTDIEGFDDLVNNHLTTDPTSGFAVIDTDNGFVGANTIVLTGFTESDFGDGTIDENDFVFSLITGTAGDDTITPGDVSAGVTGGPPSDAVDIINALGGNDIVEGGGGADNIDGGGGDDLLAGGEGNDKLEGQAGNDTLKGDGGDDTLDGGSGADMLEGGEGDDKLDGGADDDLLDGGTGVDSADFSNGEAVVADLTAGTADGQGSDTLSGIEHLIGSDFDDVLRGDVNANTLLGNDGADDLRGGDGNDTVDGGGGNDTLDGDDGADVLTGGEGTDVLFGGAGDDTLEGGDDADLIFGGADNDTLQGGEGEDILRGGDGNDSLDGGDNDDQLTGGVGADTLQGGEGQDTLSGGDGNDALEGGDNADALFGDGGDDTLDGGQGEDTLEGGEGADIFVFGGTTNDDLITDFTQGADKIDLSAYAGITFNDLKIEQGRGNDDANAEITQYGSPGDKITVENFVARNLGPDDFIFSSGNSIYISDVQVEEGHGGSTTDAVFSVSLSTPVNAPVTVDFATADGTAVAGTDYTAVNGTLTFAPGETSQTITVPISGDGAVEPNESFFVNLSNPVNDVIADGQGQGTILDDDGAVPAGTGADEVLDGADGDDILMGGNGDDALTGAAGDDELTGGSGDDAIDGGAGDDILAGGSGDDTIDGGSGDDVLGGGSDNDVLQGGAGDDTLSGGSGDDQLSGGGGNDALIGGSGNDAFVFTAADGDAGQDTIRLFNADEDTLRFEDYGESLDAFSDLDTNANGELDDGDAHVSVDAGDTVIDLGGQTDGESGGTLTLVGVTGLEADDMSFG